MEITTECKAICSRVCLADLSLKLTVLIALKIYGVIYINCCIVTYEAIWI